MARNLKALPTLFLLASPLLAVGITAPSNCLPPANDFYDGGIEHWVTSQGIIDLSGPIHEQFTACIVPQASGTWTEQFGSVASGQLFVGGANQGAVAGGANVSVVLTVASNVAGIETINTQMTQLDVNLGGGALIRIDPVTPSTGQTVITTLGAGNFQITSFFDIFTDLSLDGGATWTPSSGGNGAGGGALMTLEMPEPASVVLLGTGLLMLGFRGRRRG